ncbi:MAG TPA: 5-(carboxyamino)imidazole ribonucleotide synthase [Gammaproteobacteria bacterium]|jgi:5-(carboxyamino)imidazole ribonucleotide synthase
MKVGIIGAGQLGRMLALAGYRLGIQCVFLDPDARSSGGQVGRVIEGALDDLPLIRRLAQEVDVLTFDIENISADDLRDARTGIPVYPPPAALAVARDRLNEKLLFEEIGFPAADYVKVDSAADLDTVAARLDWPVVLKARHLGYDGRGQRVVHAAEDLERAWEGLGGAFAIAEAWVDFERELSLIGVRDRHGETAFYSLTENVHDDGILASSFAPFEDVALQADAERCMTAIMQRFDYCGVLTVEFFRTDQGLIANEIAPRVHNSGHWTIEGAETSQFENHLRAILGWPLGSTVPRGYAVMLNLLGRLPPKERLLAVPGVHFHDYGKTPRPRRKLGHCTLVDADKQRLMQRRRRLESVVAAP